MDLFEADPAATWGMLLRRQAGAFTRTQAREHGVSSGYIRAQLAARRWQQVAPRVLAAFTGPIPPTTRRWAAVLYAGAGALLSHRSAGELWGLPHPSGDARMHVTVPAARYVRPVRGIVVHRSRLVLDPTDGERNPPRTSAEATVLDLAAAARRERRAVALVADACRLGLTTHDRLARELARRPTHPHRRALRRAVGDTALGAQSVLEMRYLRQVERMHRLPAGIRQRPTSSRTRQDVHYEGYAITVELDGRQGHDDLAGRWRDMERDNASAVRGETTLRYGWDDVRHRPCAIAEQVADVLRRRGWAGEPSRCPRCRRP